jgi:hypothetical protein
MVPSCCGDHLDFDDLDAGAGKIKPADRFADLNS